MRSPASCSLAAYALALVPVLPATTNAEITLEGPYLWNIGWPATGLALVDVNGDGHLDAVTAQRSPPAITIRHNDGNGGFTPPSTWKAGITPRYVTAGDFDGDGDIDLATPDYDGFTVSVMWNDGMSGFKRSTWAPLYRPCCMTSGDMNGDGRHELVIAHWDIDANAPNAEPAHVTICSSDPLGGWRVLPPIPIGVQPRGIQVGDLDGDGALDVVTANLSSHDVSIIFNDGDGRASRVETLPLQASTQPRYLVTTDLDADGDLDLAVVARASDELWTFRNDGAGSFEVWEVHACCDNPHSVASGDLDGDELPEVIVGCLSWSIEIYPNDGDGTMAEPLNFSSPWAPAHLELGDLDGDGALDIGIVNTSGQPKSIHLTTFLNRSAGRAAPEPPESRDRVDLPALRRWLDDIHPDETFLKP
ncbi:MAG: VCBS repeat-containing protein [Phycisphaerales bacterium]|nr:VCBS repeat-containing protein [Phycisphaerales bacterium]